MEPPQPSLDVIVNQVVAEANLSRDLMLPEEIDYIREHVLKKPLRIVHVWGLGVGVVITGEYFGWNFGLPVGGPVGVLIASLVVCVLYLAWVLALSELSVAMPFAGGPLAYGRRSSGKLLGFLMAWSMFLECLFAGIGTALATGGYVAFLLNPSHPDRTVATVSAVACALVFFLVQYVGVKEQATIMLWLTYAAIAVLIWFWIAAAPGVSFERVFTHPLLPHGWTGVLGAIPYALWWLVIIETVALASEEAHDPHVTIPRGMVLAQITLVVLVMLTWFFASAAAPYAETGAVDYPLPLVFKHVWGAGWYLTAFSAMALAGMAVSYNGMIYAISRQSFSLGRAGYLPSVLGAVHPSRRTPHVSLAVWTGVTVAFILIGQYQAQATALAILISTLTALVWYVLAMVCLITLRRKEPGMARSYKVPAYPWIPVFVGILAAVAGWMYGWANVQAVVPTLILYAAALLWYAVRARKTVLAVAPEEVAARIAMEFSKRQGAPTTASAPEAEPHIFEHMTKPILVVALISLLWMIVRATGILPQFLPEATETLLVGGAWTALFLLLTAVGFLSTKRV
jgi:ethanolamine permease